jgi:probable O-glycosylation ligase (exosortase A-associated)
MGIRFILLQLTVAGASLAALVNPVIGLYAYTWYALARPDAMAWSEGQWPHSLILAIFTLAGIWRYTPNFSRWIVNPWVVSMLLLHLVILASCLFAQYPALAWGPWIEFAKFSVLALVIPLYITKLDELKWMVLVVGFSMGLVGFKFGVFGLRAGGIHFEGGLGGFISDNNTLALGLVAGLPFIWYARPLLPRLWMRWPLYVFIFFTMAAIVMTHSRGGLLSLAAMALVFVMRSKHKITVLLLMVLFAAPAGYLVYDSLAKRWENIEEDASANSRLKFWRGALAMAKDYPVFGVGYGTLNYVNLSRRYIDNEKGHVVHNNYLQMLVDSGVFALLLLLYQIYFGIFWLARSARKIAKTHPELLPYPRALEASLTGYAVGSTFLSRTNYDFYYIIIMMVACWYTQYQDALAGELKPERASAAPTPQPAQPAVWQPVPQPAATALATPLRTAPPPPRTPRTPNAPLRPRGNR